MKTIDFETNKSSHIYENNTVVVNEFLVTALTVAAVGYLATHVVLNGYSSLATKMDEIRELREKNRKRREERRREKEERRKEKEERRKEKEEEREEKRAKRQEKLEKFISKIQGKNSKSLVVYEKSIDKMPEGKEKEDAKAKLENLVKISNGTASKEEIESAQKDAQRQLSAEEKKSLEKAKTAINNVSDEEAAEFQKTHKMTVDDTINNSSNEKPKEEPKEEIKDMEVEDPETGKKVMRKVHIGPQGGKYYWPNGAPHDAEHKVYVQ